MRSLVALIAVSAFIAGCRPADAERDTTRAADPVAMPSSSAGYEILPLHPATATGDAPAGELWYRTADGALDWYVHATRLAPDRAYRIELDAHGDGTYTIASARADAAGTLIAHGVEPSLANRVCVDPKYLSQRPLEAAPPVGVIVKLDGSAQTRDNGHSIAGAATTLPCSGNDDGVFDPVLLGAHDIQLH